MAEFKNDEFKPWQDGPSRMVTVSVTMCLDEHARDHVVLRDAARAIMFHVNTLSEYHKDYVKKIEVS